MLTHTTQLFLLLVCFQHNLVYTIGARTTVGSPLLVSWTLKSSPFISALRCGWCELLDYSMFTNAPITGAMIRGDWVALSAPLLFPQHEHIVLQSWPGLHPLLFFLWGLAVGLLSVIAHILGHPFTLASSNHPNSWKIFTTVKVKSTYFSTTRSTIILEHLKYLLLNQCTSTHLASLQGAWGCGGGHWSLQIATVFSLLESWPSIRIWRLTALLLKTLPSPSGTLFTAWPTFLEALRMGFTRVSICTNTNNPSKACPLKMLMKKREAAAHHYSLILLVFTCLVSN